MTDEKPKLLRFPPGSTLPSEIQRFADAHSLSWAAAARLCLTAGLRQITGGTPCESTADYVGPGDVFTAGETKITVLRCALLAPHAGEQHGAPVDSQWVIW